MANFPRSFIHDSFLVSFLRFSRGRERGGKASFLSSFPFRFLFLSSRCQNFQFLGLVALLRLFPSTAELPKISSPSLRFKDVHKSFVSEKRELRNSRTRRYRGKTFGVEPPGCCSISKWILSLFPLCVTMITTTTSTGESKNPIHARSFRRLRRRSRAWSCFSARV